MESLGGIGYLDSASPLDIATNVARLYRDANVLSIWEGTTDVMAGDTVRVLKGPSGGDVAAALQAWVETRVGLWGPESAGAREAVRAGVGQCVRAAGGMGEQELRLRGRWLMRRVGWVVCAVLLVEDAGRDGDAVAAEVARRWVGKGGEEEGEGEGGDWRAESEWDRRIVFGGGAERGGAKL